MKKFTKKHIFSPLSVLFICSQKFTHHYVIFWLKKTQKVCLWKKTQQKKNSAKRHELFDSFGQQKRCPELGLATPGLRVRSCLGSFLLKDFSITLTTLLRQSMLDAQRNHRENSAKFNVRWRQKKISAKTFFWGDQNWGGD